MAGPLTGYRVIDLTAYVAGPYGGQCLGDLGADVIKLEPPHGDETRQKGRSRSPKMGPTFLNLNRNKRSVVLDLKRPEEQDRFRALVRSADVFLHNIRPDAAARLGASYDDLKAIRPDLIYCQIVGFGSGGPYAGRPAFDDLIQGVSGFAALQGKSCGGPRYAGFPMTDNVSGMAAALAVVAALLHRERTGEGQMIEVPMFETAVAFVMPDHMWERTFTADGRTGYPRYLSPHRKPFPTKDGHFCMVLATDRHFRRFFTIAGRAELADDPRFVDNLARSINADDLYEVMGEIFLTRTNAEWSEALQAADLPAMPMLEADDLFDDPHLQTVGFFQPVEHPSEGPLTLLGIPTRFSRTPLAIDRPPPQLGEHTEEVLAPLVPAQQRATGD